MSLWTEIYDEVIVWTGRPDRAAETNLAIRNAIRTAHKSGKYWRDLVEVTLTPTTDGDKQFVLLSDVAPRFRQVASLKYPDSEVHLDSVLIDDIIDADGYTRTNVYWGMGNKLVIRALEVQDTYKLTYYQYPIVSPTDDMDSWIADEHKDLIVLWAASTVLTLMGESEIKSRVDQLAAIAFADLQQDNLEIEGR